MVKNPHAVWQAWVLSWVGKVPQRREWLPTPVLLPGEFHGGRRLEGYSSWGRTESDVTEHAPHLVLNNLNLFSLSKPVLLRILPHPSAFLK